MLVALYQDTPYENDENQSTLVVFNFESSVSNDELRHIFGAYGEIKEVNWGLILFPFYFINVEYAIDLFLFLDHRSMKHRKEVNTNSLSFMMLELLRLLFMH